MKIPLLALALFAAVSLHAQTTLTMTIGSHTCGMTNAVNPYCYGLPVTASDGSTGSIWIDYHASPKPGGFILFLSGYEGLGLAMVNAIDPDGTVTFSGTDTSGRTYSGALDFDYTSRHACSGGHPVCGNVLTITSGMLFILYQ